MNKHLLKTYFLWVSFFDFASVAAGIDDFMNYEGEVADVVSRIASLIVKKNV